MTPEELDEISRVVTEIGTRLRAEHRSHQFLTSVGLVLAATSLNHATGCSWLHVLPRNVEREGAYFSRDDVKQGLASADHGLMCGCTNAHSLAAYLGRMGYGMERIYARIVEEAVRGLK